MELRDSRTPSQVLENKRNALHKTKWRRKIRKESLKTPEEGVADHTDLSALRRSSPKELLQYRLDGVRKARDWRKMAVSLMLTAVIVYVVFGLCLGYAVVQGESMSPNIKSGDFVVFNRLDRCYKKGDIVLLYVGENTENYIKRVVAVEGDTVDIDEQTGMLLLNGQKVQEMNIYSKTYHAEEGVEMPLTVPEGHVFVLGDNREHSEDSRILGTISSNEIEGKVLLTFRNNTL